jgi:hypothetical protein
MWFPSAVRSARLSLLSESSATGPDLYSKSQVLQDVLVSLLRAHTRRKTLQSSALQVLQVLQDERHYRDTARHCAGVRVRSVTISRAYPTTRAHQARYSRR